jgi:predicted nucleic acid-binding protein
VTYLIDTNVISELRKRDRCDANVARWFDSCRPDEVYLSVLTIGEIRRGIESIRLRDPEAAAALEGWLERVRAEHEDRILPIDRDVADEWGRLSVPDPLPVIDGLLAATAKIRGMTLVTRNTSDVERTGVSCLNPFLGGRE